MSNQQDLSIEQMQQQVTQILTSLQMLGISDRRCKKQLQILMERYQSLLAESWEKLLQDCADFCQSNNNFIAKKRTYRLRPWIKDKKSFDYLQWQYVQCLLPVGRDYMNDPDYMSPEDIDSITEELARLEKAYLPEILYIALEKLPQTQRKTIHTQAKDNPHQLGSPLPKELVQQSPALSPHTTRAFMQDIIDDDMSAAQHYKHKSSPSPNRKSG